MSPSEGKRNVLWDVNPGRRSFHFACPGLLSFAFQGFHFRLRPAFGAAFSNASCSGGFVARPGSPGNSAANVDVGYAYFTAEPVWPRTRRSNWRWKMPRRAGAKAEMKALKGRKIVAQGKRNEMSAALGSRPTKHSFSPRMGDMSRLGNGERVRQSRKPAAGRVNGNDRVNVAGGRMRAEEKV